MVTTTWTRTSQVEYWDQLSSTTWAADTEDWNDKWTDWSIGSGRCWVTTYGTWENTRETWNSTSGL